MATWEQIQADPDYQNLSDSDKAAFKQRFDASTSPSSPSPAPASAPSDNTSTSPLTPFSEIEKDPEYQKLDDKQKQAFQQKYMNAGGTINSGSGSTLTDVANAVQGGLASFGAELSNADKGIGEMATNTLSELGVDKKTAQTVGQYLSGEKQAFETATAPRAEVQTEYKTNMDNAKNTSYGRLANKYGGVLGDLTVMAAVPEVAPLLLAAKETGSAYADQAPGEKNMGTALLSGGVNYAANKFLPMAGGKLFGEGIERAGLRPTLEKAEDLIKRGLGERAGGSLIRGVENSLAGVMGGAPAGAASAYARGQDVGEGALQGAVGGAIFGGGSSVAHDVGSVLKNINPIKIPSNISGVSTKESQRISKENERINNAATHEERDQAFAESDAHVAASGLKTAQEHGLNLNPQAVRGSEGGQEALGVSKKEAGAKVQDAKEVKTNATESKTSFKNDVATSKMSNDDLFTTIKKRVSEVPEGAPGNRKLVKSDVELIDDIKDRYNRALQYADKGDMTNARKEALASQKSFDNAPDHIQEAIAQGFSAPKTFNQGFDPVAHIHQYNATNKIFTNLIDAANKTPAGKGIKIPTLLHVIGMMSGSHGLTYVPEIASKVIVGAKRSRQEAIARRAESTLAKQQTEVESKNAPSTPDLDFNKLSASHNERYLNEAVKQAKESIVDPDIAAKVNKSNITDEKYIKGLFKQDKAQNREIAAEHISNTQARKATRQAAQQEATNERLNEVFGKEGALGHVSAEDRAAATEYATKNGKILNADTVINKALELSSKSSKVGTKNEFLNYVEKETANLSQDDKSIIRNEINEFFKGKDSKLTDKQQKDLWEYIGQLETDAHANGREALGKAAQERVSKKISLVDKRADEIIRTSQREDVRKAIEEELRDSGMMKAEIADYVNTHLNQNYSKTKSKAAHEAAIKKAKADAQEVAKTWENLNPAERERVVGGDEDPILKKAAEDLAKGHSFDDEETKELAGTIFRGISDNAKVKVGGRTKVSLESIEREIANAREKAEYFLKKDPEKLRATKEAIDVIERGLKKRAANPNDDFNSWITRKDLDDIGGASAWGLKGQAYHAITGENFDANRSKIHGSETAERKARSQGGALKGQKTPMGTFKKQKLRVRA